MSSVDSLGPGTPMPTTYAPRPIGHGKQLEYHAKSGEIRADVAKGGPGTVTSASFQPRPPVRTPGVKGIGETGSFVDAQA